MNQFVMALALSLGLVGQPAPAEDAFGGGTTVPSSSTPEEPVYCQNVQIVEVEVIKYVEVTEFVEVEVPVYLPSEEESEVIWDAAANRLYAYKIQIWDGPFDTGMTLGKAVWEYDASLNDWTLESVE